MNLQTINYQLTEARPVGYTPTVVCQSEKLVRTVDFLFSPSAVLGRLTQSKPLFRLGENYRTGPVGNSPTPHRRISKRLDKNGRRDLITGLLKESPAPHMAPTGTNAVSHTRDRVRGFRLVKVRRETPKSSHPIPKNVRSETASSVRGLLSATLAQPKNFQSEGRGA